MGGDGRLATNGFWRLFQPRARAVHVTRAPVGAAAHDGDHFNDIAGYFSKEAFEELMDWEKVRFKNMKWNYEAMVAIGLNVPKPEFMTNRSRRRQTQVYESSESDEDWTPKPLTKNPQGFRIFRPPFKNENGKNT